jgi:hypothetical protein
MAGSAAIGQNSVFLGTFTHLSEGGAIDGDDGALDESLGSHKLVVRRVVDNVDDSALSGSGLGGPREGSLNFRVRNLERRRIAPGRVEGLGT